MGMMRQYLLHSHAHAKPGIWDLCERWVAERLLELQRHQLIQARAASGVRLDWTASGCELLEDRWLMDRARRNGLVVFGRVNAFLREGRRDNEDKLIGPAGEG